MHAHTVVVVDDVGERSAAQLGRGLAEQIAKRLVHAYERTIRGGEEETALRSLEGGQERIVGAYKSSELR